MKGWPRPCAVNPTSMHEGEYVLTPAKEPKRVAVIGGGDVGCELAVELCHQGKDVTIIEMLDKLMSRGGSFVANEQNLRYLVEHSGAKVMCSARMMEICDDGMIVQKDGEQLKIPCDTVVFAAGYRANHSLYEAVLDAGYDCVQVGDNVRPGKIIDAIGQGYNYIRVLE